MSTYTFPFQEEAAAQSASTERSDPASGSKDASSPLAARNRANARHSTGPRTAEGKARSSQNARTHGLSIQHHCVLEQEDPEEFETLRDELLAIFAPATPRASLAVEEMAKCQWALRRFDHAEAALPSFLFSSAQPQSTAPSPADARNVDLLLRYRRSWERRHEKALAEFDRATRAHHAEVRLQLAREKHELQVALLRQKLVREQEKQQQRQENRERCKANEKKLRNSSSTLLAMARDLEERRQREAATASTHPEFPGFVSQNRPTGPNSKPAAAGN